MKLSKQVEIMKLGVYLLEDWPREAEYEGSPIDVAIYLLQRFREVAPSLRARYGADWLNVNDIKSILEGE